MKPPACPLLIPVLTLLLGTQVRAGLAEATDFPGPWTSGSVEYPMGGWSSPDYWVDQATISIDGIGAAAGRLGGSIAAESWMQTTVTGPTTLYFSYRVRNFSGNSRLTDSSDGLFLLVGGNSIPISPDTGFVDADTGWRETSAVIPDGVQTVRWKLAYWRGDSSVRAYIDQVWTSADARPRITVASKHTAAYSTPFTWTVPVASATPATLAASGLPPGLTVDADMPVIAGTPTAAGDFEATLTALNASGRHIAKILFTVEPGITTIPQAVEAPGLLFTQPDPGTAWTGAVGLGHDGVDCARGTPSRAIGGPNNSLSATLDGPGILSFWYRCEPLEINSVYYSYISLYVGIPPSSPQATLGLGSTNWTKVTVPLSAGSQSVSWRALWSPPWDVEIVQRFVYVDKVMVVPPEAPELALEVLPSHTNIPADGNQSFGDVFVTSSASLTFSIKNTGPTSLTGLATSIDGADAAAFVVTTSPVGPVSGPNGSTSFTVQFAPSSPGAKSARLHIASNDPDDTVFDINLSGTGLQSANGPVSQGAPVSFSVNAAGGTSIQWRRDGVDIPGAVGTTLTIPSVQPWHIGVYTARLTTGASSIIKTVGLLELTDVPSGLWRGLVACYPFDANGDDVCRPNKPVNFANTSELIADPQRGGVAHVTGKGGAIPPLPGEPVELQGPGGYLQIPRPPLVDGEPYTVSFVMKEEGLSFRHGESLFTMGEGAASTDLLGHYWVGSLDGFQEIYAGPTEAVWNHTSDVVVNGSAVSLNAPWTGFTLVADGNILRLYRNGQPMGTSDYKKDTLGDSFIGRHWWENGGRFSTRLVAKIDDVRIYNRALTEPEVQQLYSVVQSTPAAGSFESWALIHGLVGADASRAGDQDRDRFSNWDEFCFGTSPTDETASLIKATFAGTTLTLEWLETAGVRYALKQGSTLVAPWTAATQTPVAAANQNGVPAGYKRMQVTIPIPATGSPAATRFFRVEATAAP